MENDNAIYASPMAEELVCVLGLPLAGRLVDGFGGQMVYISKVAETSKLLTNLSETDVQKIIDGFGGSTLAMPQKLLPAKTSRPQIIRLAEENIKNTGRPNINAIAKETGTTSRWVKMVLTQSRTMGDEHPNLF